MTTLPPEPEGANTTPNEPTPPVAPEGTSAPAAPEPPVTPPAPPAAQAAPAAPAYEAPAAPATPAAPAPQQPAPGYAAAPPPGGYAAPQQPVPAADPLSNITLNYWLSVFFLWVPALIFYLIEKDKGNAQVRALHASNLNFSLIRTGLFVASWILLPIFAFIPGISLILSLLIWAAHVVLFVFHIMAAVKVADAYRAGQADPFIFNIQMVK